MSNLWQEVRDEFPVCKKYIYLNPAGGSPVSLSAANEARRYYDEMLAEGDTLYDQWLRRTEEIRANLAQYIAATAQEIAFTTNTSHGMNLIAHMLKGNGKVLTMEHEFPSSTYPWINQQVPLKMVKAVNGQYPLDHIEKAIDPDVKILLTSYVQYSSGFKQDLEGLGQLCKKHNLIFVVNATQAIPVFPVDVEKAQIDFLVFTGLKWATAGYGIGGLYIRKKWLASLSMPFAGWQSTQEPEKMENLDLRLNPDASVLEAGCPHFAPIFALGGALQLFNRIGSENVT
ncbi:MAG: aminotransferase class V-fold PLP-dependent enzyme, partial [Bacteroidetes bacterium]|nr:aminotransferase class V-fold PLP-dependent enzyme [Bacteroidota bacterium]